MTLQSSIEVCDLSVFVESMHLMGPVSFRIDAGQTLVIMGETGAGKSLIAQSILGALRGDFSAEGEIFLDGRRVDDLPTRERAAQWGLHVAMLPQEPWRALDPLLRSGQQVAETHRHVSGHPRGASWKAMLGNFANLGLSGAEARVPGALSGGMACFAFILESDKTATAVAKNRSR